MSRIKTAIAIGLLCLLGSFVHADDLQGRKNITSPKDNLEKVLYSERNTTYENAEFAVPSSTTNWNVAANAHIFTSSGVPVAAHVAIRSDGPMTVRFNSENAPPITLSADEFPFQLNFLEVTNIFITVTTGVNVKVLIF